MNKIFLILLLTSDIFAQYPNIRVSNPSSTTPEEVTIAINPRNPHNLAAGANIKFYYYSTNGGYTWTQGQLSSSLGVWGDPCVIFDADGNLFFAHLSYPPSPGYWIDRIVVQKSTDGGFSWNNGVGIYFNPPRSNQDKEWLAVDLTNSPYKNTLYAAWTEFDSYGSKLQSDSSRILFSRSTDAGETWYPPVRISDQGGNCVDSDSTVEGAVPAVGPNGEIYLSWSGPLGIMFDKSTDGGQTFGNDIFVTSQPGGWDFDIPGIYRANGMPVTACDVSNSPYRGTIYINWSDQRNGLDNTDIFLIKSTDGGETWGDVKKVNDDLESRHQFFTWMTIDQSTGYLYIVFYDRRNYTDNQTDVYVAKSTDGGETFTNFKVSETPFTPISSIFFGDYINIAAWEGKIYPIWMRMDGTSLSVWTCIITEPLKIELMYKQGWDMVSLPVEVEDARKDIVFPSSVSGAFTYELSYIIKDTIEFGKGYWLKFPTDNIIQFSGSNISSGTIVVHSGWNMIGSISKDIAVGNITSNPVGLVTSNFYEYDGVGYIVRDTIKPGHGYWVKVSQTGSLILSSSFAQFTSDRIHIEDSGELPPSPPIDENRFIPVKFMLEQNFPNPFNPSTVIRYSLPERSYVQLKIYNLLGQEVAKLVDGFQDLGIKEVEFNANNLQSGVYYYKIYAFDATSNSRLHFKESKKMVLIR